MNRWCRFQGTQSHAAVCGDLGDHLKRTSRARAARSRPSATGLDLALDVRHLRVLDGREQRKQEGKENPKHPPWPHFGHAGHARPAYDGLKYEAHFCTTEDGDIGDERHGAFGLVGFTRSDCDLMSRPNTRRVLSIVVPTPIGPADV